MQLANKSTKLMANGKNMKQQNENRPESKEAGKNRTVLPDYKNHNNEDKENNYNDSVKIKKLDSKDREKKQL